MDQPDSDPQRTWPARLGGLAERPLVLLCVALALNALTQPYAGLTHDARLYAVQVAERLNPGSYAADRFLCLRRRLIRPYPVCSDRYDGQSAQRRRIPEFNVGQCLPSLPL